MNKLLLKNIIIASVFLFAVNLAYASPVKVIAFRVSSLISRSRLVFDTTAPSIYKVFALKNPNRLVIDFHNMRSATLITMPKHIDGVIKGVRSAEHAFNALRVVVDLRQSVSYKAFSLHKDGKQPYRLVVDLKAVIPAHHINKTSVMLIQPTKALKKSKKLRKIIVVIDPGHGGKDPGATGVRGTHEKNVVLAIAKDLQRLIDAQPGFHAYLTRTGDYFIPLRGRLRIERKYHPDMFIAIHADAYKDRYAQGASVFALSQNGATSEAARWLAQKENVSELGNTLSGLHYKSNMLRSVLINLAQTASISESLGIGDDIIHQLARVTKLHHGFVEQAAFVVLKEPDVPSLLVETGFLSNPQEELQLRNPLHQEKIAGALMAGIKCYFARHPPRGTFLMNDV